MSKLVATSLEQLSRMCWATVWAILETGNAVAMERMRADKGYQGRGEGVVNRPPVDVRLNFVVGDAIDTCDAICLLSSEGLSAWGNNRDGDEVRKNVDTFAAAHLCFLLSTWNDTIGGTCAETGGNK